MKGFGWISLYVATKSNIQDFVTIHNNVMKEIACSLCWICLNVKSMSSCTSQAAISILIQRQDQDIEAASLNHLSLRLSSHF